MTDDTARLLAVVLRRLVLEPDSGTHASLSNGDWFEINAGVPVDGDEYRALAALFEEIA